MRNAPPPRRRTYPKHLCPWCSCNQPVQCTGLVPAFNPLPQYCRACKHFYVVLVEVRIAPARTVLIHGSSKILGNGPRFFHFALRRLQGRFPQLDDESIQLALFSFELREAPWEYSEQSPVHLLADSEA